MKNAENNYNYSKFSWLLIVATHFYITILNSDYYCENNKSYLYCSKSDLLDYVSGLVVEPKFFYCDLIKVQPIFFHFI